MQAQQPQYFIKKNLGYIQSLLAPEVKLLAVSKTKPSDYIRIAYALGQRDFGENKVQDLLVKSQELSDLKDIRWHFIGKLQSNKINMLLKVENLVSIHSVDSSRLLEKLLAKPVNRKIGLFLQFNTSNEEEKSGFTTFDELQESKNRLIHDNFFLQGLMTIGRIRTDSFEKDTRLCFQELIGIRDLLDPSLELSMGMSKDMHIAQELGTNWVRIGSDIFGNRE